VCVASSSAAYCEDAVAVDAAVAAMSKSLQWTMKVEEQEVGAAAGDVAVVTSVAGAIKMDPGFKLFGKTIAVASAAAVYAFSDAGADAGALFGKRAVHGPTAPICSQVCRSSPPPPLSSPLSLLSPVSRERSTLLSFPFQPFLHCNGLFEVVLIAVRKPKQHQTWCH
jgi:hypothetical protein